MSNSLTPFTILHLTLLLITCICCRSSKYRAEEKQQTTQVSVTENQQWQKTYHSDSSQRYWMLQTDSMLYYHPDRGLWAKGGWLYAEDKRVRQNEEQSSSSKRDSAHFEQQSTKKEKETQHLLKLPWYVYGIGILLLAYCILGHYIRKKY